MSFNLSHHIGVDDPTFISTESNQLIFDRLTLQNSKLVMVIFEELSWDFGEDM